MSDISIRSPFVATRPEVRTDRPLGSILLAAVAFCAAAALALPSFVLGTAAVVVAYEIVTDPNDEERCKPHCNDVIRRLLDGRAARR